MALESRLQRAEVDVARLGPARREPVNRVRCGSKQLSAETFGCRRVAWASRLNLGACSFACLRADRARRPKLPVQCERGLAIVVSQIPSAVFS